GSLSGAVSGPVTQTILVWAARTTQQIVPPVSPAPGAYRNDGYKGIMCTLDMTVSTASPSVTLEIDAKDQLSGKYTAMLTGAAVTSNTTTTYSIYPGGPVTTNVSANATLPTLYRVKVAVGNANSGTYSVGCDL